MYVPFIGCDFFMMFLMFGFSNVSDVSDVRVYFDFLVGFLIGLIFAIFWHVFMMGPLFLVRLISNSSVFLRCPLCLTVLVSHLLRGCL